MFVCLIIESDVGSYSHIDSEAIFDHFESTWSHRFNFSAGDLVMVWLAISRIPNHHVTEVSS